MARPLTKCKTGGKPYTRPPKIEIEIDATSKLSPEILQARLSLTKPESPGYISTECLVYLIREAIRAGDDRRMDAALPIFFARCRTTLATSASVRTLPDPEDFREEILGRLGEIFAEDGSGENSDRLDFYEVRFNQAFRCLYVDAIRKERRRSQTTVPLPQEIAGDGPEEDENALNWVPETLQDRETPEDVACRDELFQAINQLPPDEQKAVVLRDMGYKVESTDPGEETIATLCRCSGRTIRNRLASAAAKLQKFKKETP